MPITPDRQLLDAWLIARITRAVVSCQRLQTTVAGEHAQQVVKRWLATFAESEAVGDTVRAAARG